MTRLTIERARAIAVASQGLAAPRPTGRIDVRHMRSVMHRIGVLQIDSVNVVARAHLLTLFARLGPYDPEVFRRFVEQRREAFEYWGHMASFNPVAAWPLFQHRMRDHPVWRHVERLQREQPGYVESVLDEVARFGPRSAAQLSQPGEPRRGAWWDWNAGKLALEWLFARGEVTVSHRGAGFERFYDIPERVIPAAARASEPPDGAEAHRRLVRRAIRSLGVATARDLIDYYRMPVAAGRTAVEELVAAGELEPAHVEGWGEQAYLDPAAPRPRRIASRALLCPFDPLIWYRPRVERLFGVHYRVEIYVPEPKRRFGYYVLPFLLGDRLVARVDLKADRGAGVLRVPGAFAEDGADTVRVARELAEELVEMAGWLGLGEVEVGRRGDLAGTLRAAL